MNSYTAPFVLKKETISFIKIIVFDFYMFIQLILFYAVCLSLGVLFQILDKIFKTKLTDSLATFFEYVANL